MRYLQKNFCSRLIISITFLFIFNGVYAQCPTPQGTFRNNGQGGTCLSIDAPPQGLIQSGRFTFQNNTGFANNQTLDSVLNNGVIFQRGNLRMTSSTIWFGGLNAPTEDLCFYGINVNDNAVPAGQWKLFFRDVVTGTRTTCTYTVDGNGGAVSFSPGTIGADQTICTGVAPSPIASSAAATGCSSTPTYEWRSSITSATSGFSTIAGATGLSLTPGTLTTTTYFVRVATCSNIAVSTTTDVVTITVNSAGTISPSAGYTWNAQTVSPTFSVTGATSGVGTWTSSNPSVATIGSSSGVVTAVTGGTSIITYSLFAGGITCTTTRSITITDNNGVLPVTWKSVSAEKLSDRVLVRWSTAAELNTRDFEVQFSTNAADWQTIGTVPAAGKSESPRDYSLLHQSPQKGGVNNFYRILQRDLDGAFGYSKIVSIIMDAPGPDVMIFPNPASNLLTVYIAESQKLRLINSSGATVWQAALSAGRHQIAVSHYQKGVYFLMTNNGPQKVVIQ
jgi:hypothetical protein